MTAIVRVDVVMRVTLDVSEDLHQDFRQWCAQNEITEERGSRGRPSPRGYTSVSYFDAKHSERVAAWLRDHIPREERQT
jgi:hypothetical protein